MTEELIIDTPAETDKKSAGRTLAINAAIVSGGMALSRLIGYVRERELLRIFGDTDVSGAYNLAFVVPDLFYNLLAGGALAAAFIPVFSKYLTNGDKKSTDIIGSSIAQILVISMIIAITICYIFAPQLVHGVKMLGAENAIKPEYFDLTVNLMRIMCFMLLFTALSGHLTGILQSNKKFVIPVVVWISYNFIILLGIELFSQMQLFGGSKQHPAIEGVSFSVVLAAISMVVIQIPAVIKTGFRFKWGIDFKHEGVMQVIMLFLPVVVSLAMGQINLMLLPIVMGAQFGLPAVTDIRAANRLVLLPLGLFGIAISTAAFPTLAQQAAAKMFTEFRKTIAQSLKVILLLSVPSAAVLFVLAVPITYLLWGGGKFGEQGIQASAFVLIYFSWGLIGLGVSNIINRAFYAMHNTLIPAMVSGSMVIASYFLARWMAHGTELKYASVAMATTITSLISTLILTDMLRRKLNGINGSDIWITTVKILIATAVMSIVMYFVAYKLAPVTSLGLVITKFGWNAPNIAVSKELAHAVITKLPHKEIFIQVLAACLSGMFSYAVMLKLLRVQEFETVVQKIVSKIRKSK